MEFSRRGPPTDGAEDGRRFPDPPLHEVDCIGDTTLVMRDALLSQLQKDRLRQEIIVAELTKIERSMALRAAPGHQATPMPRHGSDTGAERATPPWPFSAEQYRGHLVGLEHYAGVGYEHDVGSECLKPCEGKAGQQNGASDEQKLPGSGETVPPNKASPAVKCELIGITIPVKKPKTPMKWSCTVCQVQATSEKGLQDHFAGQRHQSNVAALGSGIKAIGRQKEKTAAEPSPGAEQVKTSSVQWSCSTCQAKGTSGSTFEAHLKGRRHLQNVTAASREGGSDDMPKKVAPREAKSHDSDMPKYAERPPSVWSCIICQVICTCESDLKNHLKGKRHFDKVRALLEESKKMARKYSGSLKAKLNPDNVPKHADKMNSRWFCGVCHAYCTSESDLENHLRGRRHELNIQDLWEKINQEKNNPPQIAKDQEPASEWDCSMCQAKCNSQSQFENHYRSRKHQEKIEVILDEGKIAKASSLKSVNGLPDHGSNSKSASLEKMEKQVTLYFCQVCSLQCNSLKMLAHHCTGKKHQANLNAKE